MKNTTQIMKRAWALFIDYLCPPPLKPAVDLGSYSGELYVLRQVPESLNQWEHLILGKVHQVTVGYLTAELIFSGTGVARSIVRAYRGAPILEVIATFDPINSTDGHIKVSFTSS